MDTRKYTRTELEALGMDTKQIEAVLNRQEGHEVVPVVPVSHEEASNITSFTDLQGYAKGTVVRFPDFAAGQPFVARVRRPSLLVLAKQGKIPNALLTTAGELFTKGSGGMDADNVGMLGDMYEVCEIIAQAALISPTYEEITKAGVQLSDDQLMAIFSYTQTGVKALDSFR